jgi:predicted SAM-dependent methyltransferase
MKINLGSGDRFYEGYLNVDINPNAPKVDIIADISKPLPFRDESIDAVMASHSLEHLSYVIVPDVLKDWHRVLKKGGLIDIKVPNAEYAFREYLKGGWIIDYGFKERNILPMIYGNHGDEWQLHKSLFTEESLYKLMSITGFDNIERILNNETPEHELWMRGWKR